MALTGFRPLARCEVNGGSSQVPFTNVDLKSGFRPLLR